MKWQGIFQINRLTGVLLMIAATIGVTISPSICRAATTGPCTANRDSHELDFWLGQWTIAGPGSAPNATSIVASALDNCIIVETWDGGRGHKGENWFGYSAEDKSWHGMFADNQGRVHIFVDGKVAAGSAEFSGPSHGTNGETFINRVRIIRIAADKVEQIWEKSSDAGATWVTEFRGEYLRKKS